MRVWVLVSGIVLPLFVLAVDVGMTPGLPTDQLHLLVDGLLLVTMVVVSVVLLVRSIVQRQISRIKNDSES